MIDTIVEDATTDAIPIPNQHHVRSLKAATKADRVTKILARARGATLSDIVTETGWQPHSARAFLSGLRKRGTVLVKEERKTGETSYRIVKAGLDR
jgi:DNA-binding IclR family transcriptional regulator